MEGRNDDSWRESYKAEKKNTTSATQVTLISH